MESRQFPLPLPYTFLSEGSIPYSIQVPWRTIKKEVCGCDLACILSLFLIRLLGEVWGQRELHCVILGYSTVFSFGEL